MGAWPEGVFSAAQMLLNNHRYIIGLQKAAVCLYDPLQYIVQGILYIEDETDRGAQRREKGATNLSGTSAQTVLWIYYTQHCLTTDISEHGQDHRF